MMRALRALRAIARSATNVVAAVALVVAGSAPRATAQDASPTSTPSAAARAVAPVVPHDWLVIAPVDTRGRRPFNPSATFAKHLLDPNSPPPKEGDSLVGELGPDKKQRWTKRSSDADGRVGGDPVQMAFTTVEWPFDGVALADLDGASIVWVNGVAQVGDPYEDGVGGLPAPMKKGTNLVYVTGARGTFRLAFATPSTTLVVNPFDATRGDVIRRAAARATPPVERFETALLVLNASDADLGELDVVSGSSEDAAAPFRLHRREPVDEPEKFRTEVLMVRDRLGPRGVVKLHVPAQLRWDVAVDATSPPELPIEISTPAAAPIERAATTLRFEVREPLALRRETYVSEVDGSVQEFALLPPSDGKSHPVVLTLHGAGVDCWGQAASYSQKPDFWIAAPTNRRRFGFDWQDWGRRDAYDALRHARYRVPGTGGASAAFLTGHSMGGHGTWHLAANDPDTFAAIAPSAGWSSFDSYGGGRPKSPRSDLWQAADGGSRTLALLDNLKQLPTFVLHGTADDNVPLSEAQLMVDALTKAGGSPLHHFQEGAGHWWDGDHAAGVDCVDWPEIFELFRKSRPHEPLDPIDFTTADPSYASRVRYVVVEQPLVYGEPAHVAASYDRRSHRVTATTSNVGAIVIYEPEGDVDPKGRFRVTIDGECPRPVDRAGATEPPTDAELVGTTNAVCLLVRRDGHWRATNRYDLPHGDKTPSISGPFKRAFDQSFVLVYGTAGGADETRELYERARFDAAMWWYRANGHAPVLSDAQYLAEFASTLAPIADPTSYDRTNHVILYGNRDTNRAWSKLIRDDDPIVAKRGEIRCGAQIWKGDDLGAVFVRPHPTHSALVGVFADSGVRGARLGYTLSPFLSGVGYPDYALFSSAILTSGDGGVLAAGWFDHDWSLPK